MEIVGKARATFVGSETRRKQHNASFARGVSLGLTLCGLVVCGLAPVFAQEKADGPTDEKARKSYERALGDLKDHRTESALDEFKKADKQDGGHCRACQVQMIKYGVERGDWKAAELGAQELGAQASGEREIAIAHYQYAVVLYSEAVQRKKEEYFDRAHEECGKALAAHANFPDAVLEDGLALAHLGQDEAAKARFGQYAKMLPADDPTRQRVLRYAERPELARARMAPPFTVTTTEGRIVSMDELQGKVVLLDFWATWCPPCREAVPHLREVAKKFQGQPLVILSVSLDDDEQKWKDYIAKNEMTWMQYRDGGFEGSVAKMFGVTAIPHTFTIDADGVLQDEHIGDASVEGKLRKLLVRARELQLAASSAK